MWMAWTLGNALKWQIGFCNRYHARGREGGREGGGRERGREGVGRQPPCRAPVTAARSTTAVMVAQPARGEREKERNRRLERERGRGSCIEDGGEEEGRRRAGGQAPAMAGGAAALPISGEVGRKREGGEGKRRGERGEGEIFLRGRGTIDS